MAEGRVPVTVVTITKNEERNIERCLKSVSGWADEIIVVDNHSQDKTITLAEKYANKVFTRTMTDEDSQRSWAYTQARNEWIVRLDADEVLTEELKNEIAACVAAPDARKDAYSVARRNFLGDYWIHYGGFYPDRQIRLFRKQGNNKVVGRLNGDLTRYAYRDLEHYMVKLNAESMQEAKQWFQRKQRMSLGRAIWRYKIRFLRGYIFKRGYKDGFRGFALALFAGLYQIIAYAHYWEMVRDQKRGSR